MLYDDAADWYDRVWGASRDYRTDATVLERIIAQRVRHATTLLDVGCATGGHLAHLQDRFDCTGIDLSPRLLNIASAKLRPEVSLKQADMTALDLGRRFDVVICLWGTIAYTRTFSVLEQMARRLVAHVQPGGLLAVEPWVTREAFVDPGMATVIVDDGQVPVISVTGATSRHEDVAHLRRVYVAASPDNVQVIEEHHELGLFTLGQYTDAFETAGMTVQWHQPGLAGRGLLTAARPVDRRTPRHG